jgi:tripartite-type tricarboxylate transporter receptor subunit TctC
MTASASSRLLLVLCALAAAEPASAQSYPTRPVRIVTTAPGGGSDFAARLVAQGLSTGYGQQFVVDNRGGGVVPVEIVAKAPADGYTLLFFGSTLWLAPLLQDKVPYDTLRDFAPVSLVVNAPTIVTVNPSLPVKTLKDLIALAKAKPGALNYGSGGAGSASHLSAELLKALAGIDIARVPYKAAGPAQLALVSGEIQVLMAASSGSLITFINSGKVRALATTGTKRAALFPDLPTVAEAGVPGCEYGQLTGLFAPAKTPTPLVDRMSQEVARILGRADVKEKLLAGGNDIVGSSPQESVAIIKSEVTRLGKVIRDAKIRAD